MAWLRLIAKPLNIFNLRGLSFDDFGICSSYIRVLQSTKTSPVSALNLKWTITYANSLCNR
jgi:hypothetical protein